MKIILIDRDLETFECVLTKRDVVELLLYEQIGDVIKRTSVEVDKAATRRSSTRWPAAPPPCLGKGAAQTTTRSPEGVRDSLMTS